MMAHTNKDKEVVDLLYSLIYDFVSMLLKDDYESLTKLIHADGCAHDAVFTERFGTPDSRAPVSKQYLSNGSRASCNN